MEEDVNGHETTSKGQPRSVKGSDWRQVGGMSWISSDEAAADAK